jgi:hypothetical protein
MRRLVLITIGIVATLLAMNAHAVAVVVRPDSITGRVFDSSSNRGIAGLSVQLMAPKVLKQPVRITVTNADGVFEFKGLTVGKYLLAIYRGTTLLYRKEIDNAVANTFTVPLRVMPGGG